MGGTYLNRVEQGGNNLSYSRDSMEGREISKVVSMVGEAFVLCEGGSRFQI